MRVDSSLLSAPAAIVYTVWAQTHYALSDSRSAVAGFAALVASYLFSASIATWIVSDAQRRRFSLPYDFGSLVFIAWPIFGALYVFSSRGIKGIVPIAGLLALTLAGSIAGVSTYFLATTVRHLFT